MSGSNRRAFSLSDSGWFQSRIVSCIFRVHKSKDSSRSSRRGVLLIPHVASDTRNQSTSVDSHINEKGFETIYIQGRLNLKPLVIERIEKGPEIIEEANRSDVKIDVSEDLEKAENKLSEIEKEAWELLRASVVNYCGLPVGTVAANDPSYGQTLNYDQVFVRDFVPSAMAFLLNGEGEIVKNFLLRTLQLQVSYHLQKLFICTDCLHPFMAYYCLSFN